MDMETIRERIINLFLENIGTFYTVNDIIAILDLDLKPSEVYRHIEHVARSISRRFNNKIELVMQPPRCRKCGYLFKGLKNLGNQVDALDVKVNGYSPLHLEP